MENLVQRSYLTSELKFMAQTTLFTMFWPFFFNFQKSYRLCRISISFMSAASLSGTDLVFNLQLARPNLLGRPRRGTGLRVVNAVTSVVVATGQGGQVGGGRVHGAAKGH